MSRYHVVLDRVVMSMGFLDNRDSTPHYSSRALKESVYIRLRGIEDILAHPGEKRVLRSIQRSQIAVLKDLVRLDLRALKKKDYALYGECIKDYDNVLRKL